VENLNVICFGEVLFDLFPSGAKPGGSPLNIATHLRNFDVTSGVISRVGADAYGKELLDFLKSRKVNTDLIQIDKEKETGVVRVNVDQNDDPVYTFVEKVAWDYISDSFLESILNPNYIYFGSLICRSIESNASLFKLLAKYNAKKVLDVNIRPPYYSKSVIDGLLKAANIIKMDEEEFKIIKNWFYIKNPRVQGDFKAMKALYPNIETMIITRRGKGAIVWNDGKVEKAKPISVDVKDTVGCGDAFLAAYIGQRNKGANVKDALKYASATGAFVSTQIGANPEYTEKDIIPLIPKD